jgi:ribose-phosphate pyrophosphokinase
MPYLPYSRQDKLDLNRNSLTSRLLFKMIEIAGASRIVTFDAHTDAICNFSYLPVINLNPYLLLVDKLKKLIDINPSGYVIIAPDLVRCKNVKRALGIPFALINKCMEIY